MVDHNMNRGSLNGLVLMLNVGTNTLEVGNPNVHKNTTEFTHQIQTSTTTDKKKAIADAFESNDENSSKSNGLKRMHDKEEDPEWVPDKRASKSNCSSGDSFKLKAKEAVNSNPQVNRGDSWLMYESLSGPPPSYLIKLLEYFGWKVEVHGDKYRYVSPNGVPYYSNQKAYETFLDITSENGQKRGVLSGHLQTSFYLDTTSGHSGMEIGNIASNTSDFVNDNSDADLVCEENISDFETDVEDNPHKEKKPTETLPFPNLNGPLKRKNSEILLSEYSTISNRKMKEKNTSSHFVSKGLGLINSSNIFGTDSRNLVKNGENTHTSLEIQNRQNSIQESQNVPNLYCNENILDVEWEIHASYLKGNIDNMKPPNDTTCNGTVMKSADKGKAHVSSTKASSKSCDGFVPETSKADAANIASSSNADVNGQSRSSDDVMDLEVLAMISLDNLLRSVP